MMRAFAVSVLLVVTALAVLPGGSAASSETPVLGTTATSTGLVPGDIYVTDDSARAVFRIDPVTGAQTPVASDDLLVFPLGIVVGPDGNLWVADGHALPTLDGRGALIQIDSMTWSQSAVSSDDRFEFPAGVAFAPDGDLYVTDQGSAAAQGITTADGAVYRVDPVTGDQDPVSEGDLLIDPVDIALAADGSLLVVDWGGSVDGAVIRINPDTGDQTLVSSGGYFDNSTGIAIEPDGNILVADQAVRRTGADGLIIRVDPETGTQTIAYSGDKLIDPSDLAFEDGSIVVADFARRVVRIDRVTGTQTILSQGGSFRNPFGIVVVPPPGEGCPRTPGYWKNHPNAWPVDSLVLGGKTYTMAQLLTRLKSPTRTDASLILAHQFIAAKLNLASGTDSNPIIDTVWQADDLLRGYPGLLPLGIRPNTDAGQEMVGLAYILDSYNNGALTPSCEG